jgi:hypothetical protein
MSKRKGMSLEEKRKVILNIYHTTVRHPGTLCWLCRGHLAEAWLNNTERRVQPEGDREPGVETRRGVSEVSSIVDALGGVLCEAGAAFLHGLCLAVGAAE